MESTINKPIISCVMPVYNCEKYVRQSIQSILNQTFRDFELIIVNDGCTDSSIEIIENLKLLDKRIAVINQENKGITAALNVGIAASRGRFIARMDSDDISLPDRFRVQHDFLIKNPGVVLVGGLSRTMDEHRSAISTGSRHKKTNLLCFPPKVVTALHPLMMMRAEAIKSIGGYNSQYLYDEDYDLCMRLSYLGRIAHVDHVILDYRVHGENVSLKRLSLQEKNAVVAEIDNVEIARRALGKRKLSLSTDTINAYVSLRILRRELGLGKHVGLKTFLNILYNIVKGALESELYTTNRLLLMLSYHGFRNFKLFLMKVRHHVRFHGDVA